MAKNKNEKDSAYFLKVVLYIVLGALWIRLGNPIHIGDWAINGLPIGFFIGLLFARHDHFAVDRKIEYAILILITVITFFLPAGIWI